MTREQTAMNAAFGYVSSGRFRADIAKDEAFAHRKLAHYCFRYGMRIDGRSEMRQALRHWRNYRFYRERIV